MLNKIAKSMRFDGRFRYKLHRGMNHIIFPRIPIKR